MRTRTQHRTVARRRQPLPSGAAAPLAVTAERCHCISSGSRGTGPRCGVAAKPAERSDNGTVPWSSSVQTAVGVVGDRLSTAVA